jgi:TRAP-type C4-dicarboxylate transport system permease small subunit
VPSSPDRLARGIRALHAAEDALLALVLGVMILLAAGQILLRNAFDTGLPWSAPLLRVLVLWVGLLGALAATRSDQHIAIDALTRLLPRAGRSAVHALTRLFAAAVSLLIAFHAARLVREDYNAGSVAFAEIPAWVCESILPFAFGLIGVRFLLIAVRSARAALRPEPAEPA